MHVSVGQMVAVGILNALRYIGLTHEKVLIEDPNSHPWQIPTSATTTPAGASLFLIDCRPVKGHSLQQ